MSEQPQASQTPFPNLDPRYIPATEDSGIIIRWLGNTARVAEVRYLGVVDPFQLVSLGDWLIEKGRKMIAIAEAQELAKAANAQATREASARARPQIALPNEALRLDPSMGRPGFFESDPQRGRG